LGEDAGMLDGLGPDFLPVSFLVRLDDPGMVEAFVRKVEVMGAVEKVDYPKKAIDFIAGISGWVKAFGLAIACIPMLFALFIISNTIRLAVFERSGEISIMRYIGATEHLIRWPFVVEGVLIGALGAAAAYLLTRFGYSIVESSFNAGVAGVSNNFVSLAAAGSVSAQLLALDLLFGVLIGAVGSAQAIRKHLRA
jgi:cell division transport system permease protein